MTCAALLIPDVTRDKLNRCFEKIIKRALEFLQAYLVKKKIIHNKTVFSRITITPRNKYFKQRKSFIERFSTLALLL